MGSYPATDWTDVRASILRATVLRGKPTNRWLRWLYSFLTTAGKGGGGWRLTQETEFQGGGLRSGRGEVLGKLGGGKGLGLDNSSGVESIMQWIAGKVNSHIRGEILAYTNSCINLRKRA